MENASRQGLCAKGVAVAEKEGRTAAVLKQIFRLCGREHYYVAEYGKAFPPEVVRSVLLLCVDPREKISGWPVCVAEWELANLATEAGKLITYSLAKNDANFTARNIRAAPDGTIAFEMVGFGIIGRVRLCDGSPAGVEESLAAACAAVGAGIPFAEILQALNQLSPPLSRTRPMMYKPEGQFTE